MAMAGRPQSPIRKAIREGIDIPRLFELIEEMEDPKDKFDSYMKILPYAVCQLKPKEETESKKSSYKITVSESD